MTREQFISQVEATEKAFRRFLVALCCGDSELADDIAQESYIKAYLSCYSLSNLDKFNAWIYKIGYNTFLDHRRGERLTEGYEQAKTFATQERADSSFAYQALYEALNKIPPKERTSTCFSICKVTPLKRLPRFRTPLRTQSNNTSREGASTYAACYQPINTQNYGR